MVSVNSAYIQSAEFDEDANRLVVRLRNGKVKRHRASRGAYLALINADSPGSFYLKNVAPFYARPAFKDTLVKWLLIVLAMAVVYYSAKMLIR
jgi:hypothetical protein